MFRFTLLCKFVSISLYKPLLFKQTNGLFIKIIATSVINNFFCLYTNNRSSNNRMICSQKIMLYENNVFGISNQLQTDDLVFKQTIVLRTFFWQKKTMFLSTKKKTIKISSKAFSQDEKGTFSKIIKITKNSTEMIEILISFILKIVKLLMSVCRGISRCSSGRLLKRMRGALRAM